jgi:hypothetical protein
VDFKELFKDVQQAIAVYNSDELDIDEGNGGGNNIELKDSLKEGRKQLDATREALRYLCEPVPAPREMEQFLHYFCAANPQALVETEPLRVSFYKAVATFVRAYADIAQNLTEAGYTDAEATALVGTAAIILMRSMPIQAPSFCSAISPAFPPRHSNAQLTTQTRRRSRLNSTEPCGSAHPPAGRATTHAKNRCSMPSSR